MEVKLKERNVLRNQFTKASIELEAILNSISADVYEYKAYYRKTSEFIKKILLLDEEVRQSILNQNFEETVLELELEKASEYKTKWLLLQSKYESMVEKYNNSKSENNNKSDNKRNFKLPVLEMKRFNGNIKNWLPFWGSFKKIDEDSTIDLGDKFQYLIQAMEPGSEVKEFVESFPACETSYKECISDLKARYAREDLLIQVYVRELLSLILDKKKECKLDHLYDQLNAQLRALETLGVTQGKYSPFLLPMVESALPLDILKAWERARPLKMDDELGCLLLFLKREVESDQRISMAKTTFTKNIEYHINIETEPSASCLVAGVKKIQATKQDVKTKPCLWCDKENHTSLECYQIVKMSLEQRREHLKKKKACAVCLKMGHHAKICKAFVKCYVCSKRHSPVLCPGRNDEDKGSLSSDPSTTVISQCAQAQGATLLQTLMVNIVHNNKKKTVRALIDSGSQRSYIKQEVIDSLGIPAVGKDTLKHSLFGGVQISSKDYNLFDLNIESIENSFTFNVSALGQSRICANIPHFNDSDTYVKCLLSKHNINLTDKGEGTSEVALLIGADFSGFILTGIMVPLEKGLIAIKTKLGWVLQGHQVRTAASNLTTALFAASDLTVFWSLEVLGIKDPADTKSKAQAEAEAVMSFEDTVKINAEGRYEVSLPWKVGHEDLLDNRSLAVKRLESTTKRLLITGNFLNYHNVINEWQENNIIEAVPETEKEEAVHYLPHRGVVKESSLTTKLRPVFDASARDINGKSLNSCLNKGVNFLDKIPNLLVGFRKGKIGLTADIAKAFLQICISPPDRDFLRFLWWKDELRLNIITYRHRRVVFGLTSSPFLLSATISHHLNQVSGEYEGTAKLLAKSFYVDNCITSLDTEEEVNKFRSEAKEIMNKAKFDLRQWIASPLRLNETGESVVSVLGLLWNTVTDELFLNLNNLPTYSELGKITKKNLLSITQRIFDPIGFTCPATLIPRLILQETWRRKLTWDEELPIDLASNFRKWYEHINCLNNCKIPRRLTVNLIKECSLSLHMFCDASKNAYGACVFLRAEKDGKASVQLLSAKARVAPPEKITIPRLELTAALIGSRLLAEAKSTLNTAQFEVYCWTDSSVVLCWIKRELPWNTYIGNRVREIRDNSQPNNWNHILGSLNWADLASRGCSTKDLLISRWWEGPAWLRLDSEEWPKSTLEVNEKDACHELQKTVCNANICTEESMVNRLSYFSKYTKIIRTLAWIRRYIYNLQHKEEKMQGEITDTEYEKAENNMIILIQTENKKFILERSASLAIQYDENGIIRIKTKLLLSDFPENIRFPILLPANNIVVRRIVEQRHRQLQHAGANQLIAEVRTRFWIIGIRRLVKSVISDCVICTRYRAKPIQTTSAPLPTNRLTCSVPFEVTGVDLAGPLYLRNGEKCWIVLYTCAVYRAVHLELTKSLSTEAFIMTLRRFIARRGRMKQIISDNGTNFVGTKNLLTNLDWEEVQQCSTIERIKWKMNAPTAAWWGGFWERLIRIMKELLRRILGKSCVPYEELETIICECEAVMNGRPLTYVQDDNNSTLEPLTPACFIYCFPQTDVTDFDQIDSKNLNLRYRYLQKLREDFKKRFKAEYLMALVERGRAIKNCLKVGEIVLVETEDKRVKWPLGLITRIYTGKDGVNRTAQIKTSTGLKVRPFQRLYRLEVSATELSDQLVENIRNQSAENSYQEFTGGSVNFDDKSSQKDEPTSGQTAEKEAVTDKVFSRTATRSGRVIRMPSKYRL